MKLILAEFQRRSCRPNIVCLCTCCWYYNRWLFVSSSLKFCVKYERKPAFNVKCLQFWHIFYEATRVKPWQNSFDRDKNTEILKRIRWNSRNRTILVISKFLPKQLWNFWFFLAKSSDLYFDIASLILVFTVVGSAFCILQIMHPPVQLWVLEHHSKTSNTLPLQKLR